MSYPSKDYEITVMSGKLSGSVRIAGDLPQTFSSEQAEELVRAITAVRDSAPGHKTMVTFTITQPVNAQW